MRLTSYRAALPCKSILTHAHSVCQVVGLDGVEPSSTGFGGQSLLSLSRPKKWWRRQGSNLPVSRCKRGVAPLRPRPLTTIADSNCVQMFCRHPSPPWRTSWMSGAPGKTRTLDNRVRSAVSSSRGGSELVRTTGLEPVSPRWQRSILAARRHSHGAGGATRTRVSGLEAQRLSR